MWKYNAMQAIGSLGISAATIMGIWTHELDISIFISGMIALASLGIVAISTLLAIRESEDPAAMILIALGMGAIAFALPITLLGVALILWGFR